MAEIDRSLEDVAIVRAVIALGDALRRSVIAEGIERAPQAEQPARLVCCIAQGYDDGCPMPARRLGPYPVDDLGGWLAVVGAATA